MDCQSTEHVALRGDENPSEIIKSRKNAKIVFLNPSEFGKWDNNDESSTQAFDDLSSEEISENNCDTNVLKAEQQKANDGAEGIEEESSVPKKRRKKKKKRAPKKEHYLCDDDGDNDLGLEGELDDDEYIRRLEEAKEMEEELLRQKAEGLDPDNDDETSLNGSEEENDPFSCRSRLLDDDVGSYVSTETKTSIDFAGVYEDGEYPDIDDTDKPQFELPASSHDLQCPSRHLLSVCGIYEVLRRYGRILRLSPFRVEDFVLALATNENSTILAEIHMCLLRALLKEDDVNNTMLTYLDQKDSVNIAYFLMDTITWPELLRWYLNANYAAYASQIDLDGQYPFVPLTTRVEVLQFLTDMFLATNAVREDILKENFIQHEDFCRKCHLSGEVLCCDGCPGVYHLECLDPPLTNVPESTWVCPVCVKQVTVGVTDCKSEAERTGLQHRHEPIGKDRFGRLYWFIARRIFVEPHEYSETGEGLMYYSTYGPVAVLLDRLTEEWEPELLRGFEVIRDELAAQMTITIQLTKERWMSRANKVYTNALLMEEDAEWAQYLEEKRKQEEEKSGVANADNNAEANNQIAVDEPRDGETGELTSKSETESGVGTSSNTLSPRIKKAFISACDTAEGQVTGYSTRLRVGNPALVGRNSTLADYVTDGGRQWGHAPKRSNSPTGVFEDEDGLVVRNRDGISVRLRLTARTRATRDQEEKSSALDEEDLEEVIGDGLSTSGSKSFRLGDEGEWREWVNVYSTEPLAMSKHLAQEEKDRRRLLSYKFSLTDASLMNWRGSEALTGGPSRVLHALRLTISNLEAQIPLAFYCPSWRRRRKEWLVEIQRCKSAPELAERLARLESCIKPVCFTRAWTACLGHLSLERVTASQREDSKRQRLLERKTRDRELDVTIRTRNPGVIKHTVWKTRGEEYRRLGGDGWAWVSVTRRGTPVAQTEEKLARRVEGLARKVHTAVEANRGLQHGIGWGVCEQYLQDEKPVERPSPEECRGHVLHPMTGLPQYLNLRRTRYIIQPSKQESDDADDVIDDVVNVSAGLRQCKNFPDLSVPKPACKLDSLLSQREAAESRDKEGASDAAEQLEQLKKERAELVAKKDELDMQLRDMDAANGNLATQEIGVEHATPGLAGQLTRTTGRRKVRKRNHSDIDSWESVSDGEGDFTLPQMDGACDDVSSDEEFRVPQVDGVGDPTSQSSSSNVRAITPLQLGTGGQKVVLLSQGKQQGINMQALQGLNMGSGNLRVVRIVKTPGETGAGRIVTSNSSELRTSLIKTSLLPSSSQMMPLGSKVGGPAIAGDIKVKKISATQQTISSASNMGMTTLLPSLSSRASKPGQLSQSAGLTGRPTLSGYQLVKDSNGEYRLVVNSSAAGSVPATTPVIQSVRSLAAPKSTTASALLNQLHAARLSKFDVDLEGGDDEEEGVAGDGPNSNAGLLRAAVRRPTILRRGPASVSVTPSNHNLATVVATNTASRVANLGQMGARPTQTVFRVAAPDRGVVGQPQGRRSLMKAQHAHTMATHQATTDATRSVAEKAIAVQCQISSIEEKIADMDKRMRDLERKLDAAQRTTKDPVRVISKSQDGEDVVKDTQAAKGKAAVPSSSELLPPYSLFTAPGCKDGTRSLFRPHAATLRSIILAAGRREVPGYDIEKKRPGYVRWPYPSGRPSVTAVWRYKLALADSAFALAVQLRLLWCVLRWDDILEKAPPSGIFTEQLSSEGRCRRRIIEMNALDKYSLTAQYLVELVDMRSMNSALGGTSSRGQGHLGGAVVENEDDSDPDFEPYTPARSGLRKRARKRPGRGENGAEEEEIEEIRKEEWWREDKLQLWEIRTFIDSQVSGKPRPTIPSIAAPGTTPVTTVSNGAGTGTVQDQMEVQIRKQRLLHQLQQYQLKEGQGDMVIMFGNKKITTVPSRQGNAGVSQLSNALTGVTPSSRFQFIPGNRRPSARSGSVASRGRKPARPKATPRRSVMSEEKKRRNSEMLRQRTFNQLEKRLRTLHSAVVSKKKLTEERLWLEAKAEVSYIIKSKDEEKQRRREKRLEKQLRKAEAKAKRKRRRSSSSRHGNLDEPTGASVSDIIDAVVAGAGQLPDMKQSPSAKRRRIGSGVKEESPAKAVPVPKKRGRKSSKSVAQAESVAESPTKEAKPSHKRASGAGRKSAKAKAPAEPDKPTEPLYCVCKTPYDPSKQYIGCDLCQDWFHFECVAMSEKDASKVDTWVCPDCSEQEATALEEVYCTCRTPYDNTKVYIACDGCDEWFHSTCVGLTNEEVANHKGTYLCPNCRKSSGRKHKKTNFDNKIKKKSVVRLTQIVDALKKHKMAWPFLKPVNLVEHPKYFKVVPEPIDLSIVSSNLEHSQYNTIGDFSFDVHKIFTSCRIYFPKESPEFQCADVMETFFIKEMKKIKNKL